MLNLISKFYYYKAVEEAVNLHLIKIKDGVKLYNILKYGKLTCEICGKPIRKNDNKKYHLSFDHIIPKAEGGLNTLKNLRITHCVCNNNRGGKLARKYK